MDSEEIPEDGQAHPVPLASTIISHVSMGTHVHASSDDLASVHNGPHARVTGFCICHPLKSCVHTFLHMINLIIHKIS